jgi:hypothetical protein
LRGGFQFGYDPPDTATPELDDELTLDDDDCRPLEAELELVELVEVLAEVVCDDVETPGIVCAPTAPSKPTPTTAKKATPVVTLFSIRIAASRAWILVAVGFGLSMDLRVASAHQATLGESWEVPEKMGANRAAFQGSTARRVHSRMVAATRPRSSGDRAGRS